MIRPAPSAGTGASRSQTQSRCARTRPSRSRASVRKASVVNMMTTTKVSDQNLRHLKSDDQPSTRTRFRMRA